MAVKSGKKINLFRNLRLIKLAIFVSENIASMGQGRLVVWSQNRPGI
jgi:hypothetical protein